MAITKRQVTTGFGVILVLGALLLLWLAYHYKGQLFDRVQPFVGDTTPMNGPGGDLPRDVLAWKVSLKRQGNIIGIDYTEVGKYHLKQGETIRTFLDAAVKNQLPSDVKWYAQDKIKWEERPDHHDRETPLSIRHNGNTYMVFILDDMNWHFTARHDPFEVYKDKEHLYTDPLCAWREKPTDPVSIDRQPGDGAACRIASFAANAKKDLETNADGIDFVTPFNFYVSIRVQGKHRPRYLPLVIDPDVGYPGGNYPLDGP